MQPLALTVRFFPVGCADAIASGDCVSSVRCVSDDGLPRGADAPRSCVGVRTSAGEKTMFAMHERTLPGAAGVSPPWVGECASADTSAIRRQTADDVCADCRCIRVY